jgi:hypothetical protein
MVIKCYSCLSSCLSYFGFSAQMLVSLADQNVLKFVMFLTNIHIGYHDSEPTSLCPYFLCSVPSQGVANTNFIVFLL